MALLWLAVLTVLAGSSSARPNRIVGGEPTTIENYPSIVQVEMYSPLGGFWGHGCAGTIITSRYIISAAHCFHGLFYQPNWRRFRAGTTYHETGGVIHSVEAVYNHPSYADDNDDLTRDNYDGDINVVRLATPLVYSSFIQPAPIPVANSTIPDNLPVVYAGWGAMEDGGETPSEVLRHVQVYTVNHTVCTERYSHLGRPYIVTENMLCAGILDVGGKDGCQGDSGGPLYYGNILIGVISWGYGCARPGYPGVSANVASYTDWIVSVAV